LREAEARRFRNWGIGREPAVAELTWEGGIKHSVCVFVLCNTKTCRLSAQKYSNDIQVQVV